MAKAKRSKIVTEVNKMKRQEKHSKRHPNDKGQPRPKVQDYDTCSICGGKELPKYMESKLMGDEVVMRCRSCRHTHHEGFANSIPFPKGLKASLPKGE